MLSANYPGLVGGKITLGESCRLTETLQKCREISEKFVTTTELFGIDSIHGHRFINEVVSNDRNAKPANSWTILEGKIS